MYFVICPIQKSRVNLTKPSLPLHYRHGAFNPPTQILITLDAFRSIYAGHWMANIRIEEGLN